MIRRRRRDLASDLAHEVATIARRLVGEQLYIVLAWNLYRNKDALLEVLHATWREVTLPELLTLQPEAIVALERFHAEVDRFRRWVQFTDVMPLALDERYDLARERIVPAAEAVRELLGDGTSKPPEDPWTAFLRVTE